MALAQGIAKGDALQKLGSLGFIIGAVTLLVFNALLPRATDPSNTQDVLATWGRMERLGQLSGLFLAVGMWGLMIGASGIRHSITAGGATWARLGFYGIVVGTAIFSVTAGVIAVEARAAAAWVAAPAADKAVALSVAATIHAVCGAILTMGILVEWLAIVFLSIGMVHSAVYPKWQGWAGLVLGVIMIVFVGLPRFFAGTTSTAQTFFAILAGLSPVWAGVVGIWIARKAW